MALSAPVPLAAEHVLDTFDCGKPALNAWLLDRAQRNQGLGFTAVVVIHEGGRVVGFSGLAPSAIHPSALPRSIRTGQSPTPMPCMLLGQLAVDLRWQGQRVAARLLLDAFQRAVNAAALVGGRALIVHAIDADALAFWQAWGFRPTLDDPFQLFRGLADIRASLASSNI